MSESPPLGRPIPINPEQPEPDATPSPGEHVVITPQPAGAAGGAHQEG